MTSWYFLYLQLMGFNVPWRTITLALTLGLCGGLAKGRFVLAKTALRNKRRLQKLNQASPWQIFAPGLMGILEGFADHPPWSLTNIAPENSPGPNRKIVSQPPPQTSGGTSNFRGLPSLKRTVWTWKPMVGRWSFLFGMAEPGRCYVSFRGCRWENFHRLQKCLHKKRG